MNQIFEAALSISEPWYIKKSSLILTRNNLIYT